MINLKKEGDVIEMVNKILSLLVTLIILTGCNQLAMLSVVGSTASLAVSNNTYSKLYSGTDVLTFIATEKDIKTHVYDTVTTAKKVFVKTSKEEKQILVSYPVVEVKISEIFKPDDGFYLAKNMDNYKSKEEIEWEIESKGWIKIYGG